MTVANSGSFLCLNMREETSCISVFVFVHSRTECFGIFGQHTEIVVNAYFSRFEGG